MSEPPSPGRPQSGGVRVLVCDEQSEHRLDPSRWARLAEHALVSAGCDEGELSLLFVDEAVISELNRRHLGGEGPTDVLAFPIDGVEGEGPSTLLGDVVICPAVAAGNAAAHGDEPLPGHPGHDGSLEAELALLVVHGVLHVLGMDHAGSVEAAAMQEREAEILASFASAGGTAPA